MVILADTSVWIGHLRSGNSLFKSFLEEGVIVMHPCVRCELSLGSMKNRVEILGLLAALPQTNIATEDEVLFAIEKKKLWGLGIGWVDVQLLAATRITPSCSLWTFDGPLRKAGEVAGAKLFHCAV